MLSDTIAALATPPGRSALAVIRLSGDVAFAVAAKVVEDFGSDRPRVSRLARFRDRDGTAIDEGLYVAFPGPGSYTGEDLVELTCHGGLLTPTAVLASLCAAGARPAAPGEFTRRAVLNGKLDLIQAEAVGDLVDATAPNQARAALDQLDGGLSKRVEQLRSALVELQALLSYAVDFPEEDDGPVSPERVAKALGDATAITGRMLRTAPAGQRLREGALVVIAGRPNAGKSSLFNALLGTNRTLVSEIPGTTRDTVEAFTEFKGWPIRLADTAGIGDFENPVDRLGVEVSHRYLEAADLVLLCVEGTRDLDPAEQERVSRGAMLLRTKSDLGSGNDGIPVSVVTGEGLDAIRTEVAGRVFQQGMALGDMEPVLTRERHRDRLSAAHQQLTAAAAQLPPRGDPVLVSHHVRAATEALDELIGVVDVEAVLDRVFASFCIGK
ncbi:MAG: tRNA uridine-5-carboxymethylaminomethyl(34) synthesis GTPase MnmE [Gemmatimonadota bacterium]